MKLRLTACATAFLVAATVPGYAGITAPTGEPLSSSNVELLATIPTGTGVGGKFHKGYYFQTTARMGGLIGSAPGSSGLLVFDVANPELPVLAAHLPLPHWQNEDVEIATKRNLLLISVQRWVPASGVTIPGALYVIDIANPLVPTLVSRLEYPTTVGTSPEGTALGGPGHIANCVLDCKYVYVGGARDGAVHVVDLRKADAPKFIGKVKTPAGAPNEHYSPGVIHDVNVDGFRNVWMTGSGGTAMYAPITNPLKPRLVATVSPGDNARLNQLIHHGSLRFDKNTVLVGEEAFDAPTCGGPDGDEEAPQDGSLQTWRIDLKKKRLRPMDTYDTVGNDVPQSAFLVDCSSHWFDLNKHKVVADAWYYNGVRFLDLANPKRMRPIGWYIGVNAMAGQTQYVPGRADLVYVADYNRGLDVIKIANGGKGAKTQAEPLPQPAPTKITFEPDPDFGYACPLPIA